MSNLEDKEIKAAYEILKSSNGMYTIIFRNELGDIIKEDEDKILLDIEEKLIIDGWIFQDLKSRLLTPTKKLLNNYSK